MGTLIIHIKWRLRID